ncbi:xanthine dehydrogenase family protein molybdopterin-binding subunit [Zhaonella formicivorans]|jgi:CO/xanthine dehydrogenase Mo-binding subunit|uniref:xanthine dehydrogenase family protein molybdopterin-binding subunit n=1 Tax=Zhaonella formicivorans TaxID=2528593 RepID=UPI0010F23BCA|nr:molybdopterin cofactor-binding domain-containing protein [Zhaonella formicivorans]
MKKRGIGMGCIFYGTGYGNGFPDVSTAYVEIHDDGSALVITGAVDCGQGSTTILAQIAAEELSIPVEKVTVTTADTDCTPDSGTTAATRQTYTSGNAVRLAAQKAKQVLLEWAARELGVNTTEGLRVNNGMLEVKGDPAKTVPLEEICAKARFAGKRLIGEASFTTHATQVSMENGQGAPYWPYAFGTQIVEVEVDTETGKVEILKVIAAHDVGKAINPENVKGQIQGGVGQGVGWSLYEEVQLKEGQILNPSMSSYLIPTVLDMPEIEPVIVEAHEPSGPYGAKGVGEPAMLPTAPAVLNAIYNAIGVRINDLPATPEKVLAAIKEAGL